MSLGLIWKCKLLQYFKTRLDNQLSQLGSMSMNLFRKYEFDEIIQDFSTSLDERPSLVSCMNWFIVLILTWSDLYTRRPPRSCPDTLTWASGWPRWRPGWLSKASSACPSARRQWSGWTGTTPGPSCQSERSRLSGNKKNKIKSTFLPEDSNQRPNP